MIEIILGIIVLILAIIGIAKLIKGPGGPRGPGGARVDIDDLAKKMNVYGKVQDAKQALAILYYIANVDDPRKASAAAENLFNYIGEHEKEFYNAAKVLGYKSDLLKKEISDLKKIYDQYFDEKIAGPKIRAMEVYEGQRGTINTALREVHAAKPSFYALFAKAISGKQASEDIKNIVQHYRNENKLEGTANERMTQARTAQDAMAQAKAQARKDYIR